MKAVLVTSLLILTAGCAVQKYPGARFVPRPPIVNPGTNGSITITPSNTKITAIAWSGLPGSLPSSDPTALTCIAAPFSPSASGWSKVTVSCQAEGYALGSAYIVLNDKLGGAATSFTTNNQGNSITWMFSKAEPAGDFWQVSANGNAAFQSGVF